MLLADLRKKLDGLPDDTQVYLDDTLMPTFLSLCNVEYEKMNGFIVATGEPIQIGVVTLSTYRWDRESDTIHREPVEIEFPQPEFNLKNYSDEKISRMIENVFNYEWNYDENVGDEVETLARDEAAISALFEYIKELRDSR